MPRAQIWGTSDLSFSPLSLPALSISCLLDFSSSCSHSIPKIFIFLQHSHLPKGPAAKGPSRMWKHLAQVLPLCYWHHRLGQLTYSLKGELPARLAGADIYLSPPGDSVWLPLVGHGWEFPKWSPNAAAPWGM